LSGLRKNITDTQLTKRLKEEGCNESFVELSQRYENVFYKICQKYRFALRNVGVQPEDVYEEKDTVLLKCALSFDPTRKTKFSTWLGNYAKFTCLNFINSKKYIFNTETEDLQKFIEENLYAPTKEDFSEEAKIILNKLKQLKDKRIEKIFKMRYFYQNKKDSTWKAISEEIGVSIQTAINLHKKGIKTLRNQILKKIS
jgi:RNA polymerase sigma factor (sigma-70 family)